jgi:7-carboxy-7-deazaguanine synthase
MTVDKILAAVSEHPSRLVEITGGEPMEQEGVYPLIEALLAKRYTVMLETGGHIPLDRVPIEVIKIIDVKCPDSGECGSFSEDNLRVVEPHDEFKFVLASRTDYEWARQFVNERLVGKPNTVLFSPAHGILSARDLSNWVLSDGMNVRLQLQNHKFIWGADARGV